MNGGPLPCGQGDTRPVIDKIIGCDGHPVSRAGEFRLVRVDHVNLEIGGLGGACVVEGNAGDSTRHSDLVCCVNLFGKGVVVERIERQITIRCRTSSTDFHNLLRRQLQGTEPYQRSQDKE